MKSYTLDCKCCARKRGCLHKRMSLWHLSEVWPGLVEQPAGSKEGEEVSDQEMDVSSTAEAEPTSNQGTASLQAVLEYELQHKRIPPEVTPQKLKSRIDAISPTETVCPLGNEHPQLITEISTTNAKLIDLAECRDGNCCCTQHCIVCGFPDKSLLCIDLYIGPCCLVCLLLGIHVYVKTCPVCMASFRYQEHTDGLHNFNNALLLSLDLCLFLRTNLQVSTPSIPACSLFSYRRRFV